MDKAFEVHMLNEQGKGMAKAIAGEFPVLAARDVWRGWKRNGNRQDQARRGVLFREEGDGVTDCESGGLSSTSIEWGGR